MGEIDRFEGKNELDPEKEIKMIIDDLAAKVKRYTLEELEIIEKNLPWTIEGDKRKSLLTTIEGTKNLSEAEMLDARFREAEKEIGQKDK